MRSRWLWLLLLVCAGQGHAHLLNMTEVEAQVGPGGQVTLTLQVDLLRATGSAAAYHALGQEGAAALTSPEYQALWERLVSSIELDQGGSRRPLSLREVEPPRAPLSEFESSAAWPMTRLVLTGKTSPGEPIKLRFRSSFPFEEPIALSFTTSFSEQTKSRWLIANQSSARFAALPGNVASAPAGLDWGALRSASWQGVLHVLPGGLDHVLFLLCLFLATRNWRERVVAITLFTLSHSLTLALAAYRVIELPAAWVEAAIAASILVVALANLTAQRARAVHGVVILGFGLIHGFGFAGALRQLSLPAESFLPSLLAFNLGVELGQLVFLALLWSLLWHAARHEWYQRRVALPLSSMAALVSGVWLLQRLAQA